MIITKRQKEHLLDAVTEIQFELGTLIKQRDSEEAAFAAGEIMKNLCTITSALNHSEIKENNTDELFF